MRAYRARVVATAASSTAIMITLFPWMSNANDIVELTVKCVLVSTLAAVLLIVAGESKPVRRRNRRLTAEEWEDRLKARS